MANENTNQTSTTTGAPDAASTAPAATSGVKEKEKRVEIFIPRAGANEDPNLFVSINGVNYLLPKGKTSFVPPHVKAEIERGRKAEADADARSAKMANDASK